MRLEDPVATTGWRAELALGFLWTERVIERPEQVVSVTAHARTSEPDDEDHVRVP